MSQPTLKRDLTLPILTLYGLGNVVGAGIYVLIGKVAGEAGYAMPLSFLIAFGVAALTAFSYMELSSRYPKTAGVSVYLHQAFGSRWLSAVVGLLLVAAGMVSAATLANGFVGYFQQFWALPDWIVIIGIVGSLTALALNGIHDSARLAVLFTILELVGLVVVVVAASSHLSNAGSVIQAAGAGDLITPGLLVGAFIAFYAFIGFEDMVDVVEEVKNPRKTMPRAILLALVGATILYLLVIVACLLVVTPQQLASSDAPLALVYTAATGNSPVILAAIGSVAITGGILVNLIMGSRVLYGLAQQRWIPSAFAHVNKRHKTPTYATIVLALVITALAILVPLVNLAELTSFFILIVFLMVHIALVIVKRRGQHHHTYHEVSTWVPVTGIFATLGMLSLMIVE